MGVMARDPRSGENLEREILIEKAAALKRTTDRWEAALAAFLAIGDDDAPKKSSILEDAADALWCFLVQRDAMGLSGSSKILESYNVPAEIRSRIGPKRASRQDGQQ